MRRAGVWIVVTLVTSRLSDKSQTPASPTSDLSRARDSDRDHKIFHDFIQMLRAKRNSFSFCHLNVNKTQKKDVNV